MLLIMNIGQMIPVILAQLLAYLTPNSKICTRYKKTLRFSINKTLRLECLGSERETLLWGKTFGSLVTNEQQLYSYCAMKWPPGMPPTTDPRLTEAAKAEAMEKIKQWSDCLLDYPSTLPPY